MPAIRTRLPRLAARIKLQDRARLCEIAASGDGPAAAEAEAILRVIAQSSCPKAADERYLADHLQTLAQGVIKHGADWLLVRRRLK